MNQTTLLTQYSKSMVESSALTEVALEQSQEIREALENATRDFEDTTKKLHSSYQKEISRKDQIIRYLALSMIVLVGCTIFLTAKITKCKC